MPPNPKKWKRYVRFRLWTLLLLPGTFRGRMVVGDLARTDGGEICGTIVCWRFRSCQRYI